MSIHRASKNETVKLQIMHARLSLLRFVYKRTHTDITSLPANGPTLLLYMTLTSMMVSIDDQDRSKALFACMHANFDDRSQSFMAMLDLRCNKVDATG